IKRNLSNAFRYFGDTVVTHQKTRENSYKNFWRGMKKMKNAVMFYLAVCSVAFQSVVTVYTHGMGG
ncbi:hypothetical protein, partial [Brevibacillus laterosporus]|uniref:hypothetical protein n=1 Tax=Brevibacillus laterosporus TaxID=1465 RepID=UPI001A7EF1C0